MVDFIWYQMFEMTSNTGKNADNGADDVVMVDSARRVRDGLDGKNNSKSHLIDDLLSLLLSNDFISRFRQLFTEHFILIALGFALIIAFFAPNIGYEASQQKLGYQAYGLIEFINNVIVFYISGLTLKIEEMTTIWTHRYSILYGLCMINFVSTLLVFVIKELTFLSLTNEYLIGLCIFVTVPTTLGVGVALTYASKGDVIMSLFLTVTSNMLGIITVPFLLRLYFAGNDKTSNIHIEPTTLAFRLTLTVMIPTITGIICRQFIPGVIAFTKLHREFFSMFSMANLMCMVWMSLSKAKKLLMKQDISEIFILIALNIIIHSCYLLINYLITWKMMKISLKQAISLLIMCSQKSSPVALSVIAIIASHSGQQGLLIIPCIIGQLTQIFMGYVYSRWLSKYVTSIEEAAETVPSIDEEKQNAEEEQEQEVFDHTSSNNNIDVFSLQNNCEQSIEMLELNQIVV